MCACLKSRDATRLCLHYPGELTVSERRYNSTPYRLRAVSCDDDGNDVQNIGLACCDLEHPCCRCEVV